MEHVDIDDVGATATRIAGTRIALQEAVLACLDSGAAVRRGSAIQPMPHPATRAHLANCVQHYAAALESAGQDGRQFASVKRVVGEAMDCSGALRPLRDVVARWCIAAYLEPR